MKHGLTPSSSHFIRVTLLSFPAAAIMCLGACSTKEAREKTPWGTLADDTVKRTTVYTLDNIVANGEIIMLTLSGPDTYYDYRDEGRGLQYVMFRQFARQTGVSVRAELCKDTAEMVNRLQKGDGDVIVFQLPRRLIAERGLTACGAQSEDGRQSTAWAVASHNGELAAALDHWYKPDLYAKARKEEQQMAVGRYIRRRVYSPIRNAGKGIISDYDALFMRYAPLAGMDWRLLAAQCYQESAFDPGAQSWAGACGLMQLMPATAARHGLPTAQIYQPEANVEAAARHLAYLNSLFADIRHPEERTSFILAAYNAGYGHVQDARKLAAGEGRNPQRWDDVSHYILMLSRPEYYRRPEVRYGYMRGDETFDYVRSIRMRYDRYSGVAHGNGSYGVSAGSRMPQRATKRHRFSQ